MSSWQARDGSRFASFDGLFLEVSGLSGSAKSIRLAVESIAAIELAQAGEERMFVVRSKKGGFGLALSANAGPEWDAIVQAVRAKLG